MNQHEVLTKKWYGMHPRDGAILDINDPEVDRAGASLHSYMIVDDNGPCGRLGNIISMGGGTVVASGWMEPQGQFSSYEKAKEHVESQVAIPENWDDIMRVLAAGWDISVSKFNGRWWDELLMPPGDANQ